MDKIKLGFVGCGVSMRIMFASIMKYMTNAEMTAVMDPNRESAMAISKDYGPCDVFDDLDEMLAKADIDAVVICSPVFCHESNVVKAAKAGKHVFCEKPMARNVAECDNMIKACRDNKVKLMVGFMKRFNPCFQRATDMIQAGELGEVFKVDVFWDFYSGCYPMNWRETAKCQGGLFLDHGSHTLNLAMWWLGEIKSIQGQFRIIKDKVEVDDVAVALCKHENGAISVHQHTSMSHKYDKELYRIYGSKATLEIWFDGGSWTSNQPFNMRLYKNGCSERKIDVLNEIEGLAHLDGRIRGYNAYYRELAHFCQCVIDDKEPRQTGIDGRNAIEATNALYISSSLNKTVHLPLQDEFKPEDIFYKAKG